METGRRKKRSMMERRKELEGEKGKERGSIGGKQERGKDKRTRWG